jgi:hypothetical protein
MTCVPKRTSIYLKRGVAAGQYRLAPVSPTCRPSADDHYPNRYFMDASFENDLTHYSVNEHNYNRHMSHENSFVHAPPG